MSARRILPCGDLAFIVELDDLDAVIALHAALTADPQPGQTDVIAAASTVLVRAATPVAADKLAQHVRGLEVTAAAERDSTLVELDVLYDGEDLDDVAALLGMSRDAVIEAHTGQIWTAAFGGFAPGFTYCVGENNTLDVPRRETPRTALPAKSVAIAGHFSAVYPRQSPGGWQLLGRTDTVMWDANAEKPAYVAPGNRVKYRAVRELVEVAEPPPPEPPQTDHGLVVVKPGLQSLLQDLGRPGHADLGVSESGAMDLASARRANKLVGNKAGDAVVETLLGGLTLRAVGDHVLAVTGATTPIQITGPGLGGEVPAKYTPPTDRPFALLDGQTLALGAPEAGMRAYVAVRGGIEAPRVLGSRSADLLSGEGPDPLKPGDVLPVREAAFPQVVNHPDVAPPLPGEALTVHLTLGPRDDWFDSEALDTLFGNRWVITDRSNRVGLRLDGPAIQRREGMGELASEGCVAGSIQIPPDGKPVLFMRDHPVTGGYPVIGVVESADINLLAQMPAGSTVRFMLYHRASFADDAIGLTAETPKDAS